MTDATAPDEDVIVTLPLVGCAACGHTNRLGARFCEECGAALASPATTAESNGRPLVDLRLPDSVGGGRYKVRRLLGEGARKRVYAALDERLGREVAVAMVKTDGLDATGRERIEREARAMARLGDHAHIVTVFDVGDDEGQPFIVSQLMPGGSVAELLAAAPDHRLAIDDGLRIGLQLAGALDQAHRQGVIHRDL